jgi:hypothetical protein
MAKINWSSPSTLKIVRKEIKNSPDNLRSAFQQIALKLNCSQANVSSNWYTTLRHKSQFFKTQSTKTTKVNGKNSPRIEKTNKPIHEMIVSTKKYDGMKVVTVKQYFPA